MIVKLKRNFYLGDNLYKARPEGVFIPDSIDGKPVMLPRDAVKLDVFVPPKAPKVVEESLSQHHTKASKAKSFVAAMKSIEDED